MTTDETIAAIEALRNDVDVIGWDLDSNDLKALAAELKLYREFVGAMITASGKEWFGDLGVKGFSIYNFNGKLLATGTDPFAAWRNMREPDDKHKV